MEEAKIYKREFLLHDQLNRRAVTNRNIGYVANLTGGGGLWRTGHFLVLEARGQAREGSNK